MKLIDVYYNKNFLPYNRLFFMIIRGYW